MEQDVFVFPAAETAAVDPGGMSRADTIGIGLSILCAIHCAAMPVLIAMLPTLGLSAFEKPWVHQALFVGCFLMAGNAVLRGFRLHGRRSVLGFAAMGLGLLAASAFVWPAPCCAEGACGETTAVASTSDGAAATSCCTKSCCSHGAPAGNDESPANDDAAVLAATSGPAPTDPAASSAASPAGHSQPFAQVAAVSESVPAVSGLTLPTLTTELWLRLMTPLGGVLLIVAHCLNIRWTRNCQCGCCPTTEAV